MNFNEIPMRRSDLVRLVVDHLLSLQRCQPLRVAVTGIDASGKTHFADELGEAVSHRDRHAVRVSIDDFYRPSHRARAEAHAYTPVSYYEEAIDYPLFEAQVLTPAGQSDPALIKPANWDLLKNIPSSAERVEILPQSLLIVDGVFLLHPVLRAHWDTIIWLEVDWETALQRALTRDSVWKRSPSEIETRYRDRNFAAHRHYVKHTGGSSSAEIVIDNTSVDHPKLLRFRSTPVAGRGRRARRGKGL